MTDVFNTKFELSLRILLILGASAHKKISIDKLVGIDFITVYGKDFYVSEYNLHGDNDYRFSEYTSRRDMVFQALKSLVLQGYIAVSCLKSGFYYSITDDGRTYCDAFSDNYATEYSTIVSKTIQYVETMSDRKLFRKINSFSIELLRGGLLSE